MKQRFAMIIIAAALLAPARVLGAPPERQDPQSLASEGVRQLMRAMELMLLSIPQFEAPEINENGDIIIRRKHPESRGKESDPAPRKRGKSI